MYKMRDGWTDERMDDFRDEVNRRFDKFEGDVNRRFGDVDRRFDKIDRELLTQRAEMGSRFERIEARIDDVNTTLMRFGFGAIVTFVVGFAGMIATQL